MLVLMDFHQTNIESIIYGIHFYTIWLISQFEIQLSRNDESLLRMLWMSWNMSCKWKIHSKVKYGEHFQQFNCNPKYFRKINKPIHQTCYNNAFRYTLILYRLIPTFHILQPSLLYFLQLKWWTFQHYHTKPLVYVLRIELWIDAINYFTYSGEEFIIIVV